MILLDLQSFLGVKKSLAAILNCEFHEFEQLVRKQILDESKDCVIDVEVLIKEDKVDLESFKLEDIYFKVYHFTTRTSAEKCKQEILNLPKVITTDSDLRSFLASFGIEVFPDEQLIKIGTATLPISEEGEFEKIYSKLYVDPEIWGFLRTLDITDYQDVYPNYPEFIHDIANVVEDTKEFESAWQINYGNPFVIEFIHPYNRLNIYGNNIDVSIGEFTKEYSLFEYELDNYAIEFENYQKQGLIQLLLVLYFGMLKRCDIDELLAEESKEYRSDVMKHANLTLRLSKYLNKYDDEHSEIRTALNKGENVATDSIVKVWEFDDFQTEAKLGNCYLNIKKL